MGPPWGGAVALLLVWGWVLGAAALVILVVLAALSFILSVLLPGYDRGDSFYLPQFRAWEQVMGVFRIVEAMARPACGFSWPPSGMRRSSSCFPWLSR